MTATTSPTTTGLTPALPVPPLPAPTAYETVAMRTLIEWVRRPHPAEALLHLPTAVLERGWRLVQDPERAEQTVHDLHPDDLAYVTALAEHGPCTCTAEALCVDETDALVDGVCLLCDDLPEHMPCPAEDPARYPVPPVAVQLAALRAEHHRFVDEVRAIAGAGAR